MKRTLGLGLFGLGVLLIVLAAATRIWVAPQLIRAPLDINVTLKATGQNFQYLDATTGAEVPITVDITRHIQGDVAAGNHNVAVYEETLCLTRDDANQHPGCLQNDPRIITNSEDRIAFDRVSGEAVNGDKCGKSGKEGCGESVDGVATEHQGLGYKFPMNTQQTTYKYFDTVALKATDIAFKAIEERDGLRVYRFQQVITDVPAMTNGVLPSLYSDTRTVWVEPQTGAIIHGEEQLDQRLTGLASLEPGAAMRDPALAGKTALKGTLVFTAEADAIQAKLARDGIAQIRMVRTILPLSALILGLVLAGGGLLLGGIAAQPELIGRRGA